MMEQRQQRIWVNDKCGVLYGWHATALWPLQDNLNQNPDADWRPYQIVTSEESAEVTPGINMMTSSWYAVALSVSIQRH